MKISIKEYDTVSCWAINMYRSEIKKSVGVLITFLSQPYLTGISILSKKVFLRQEPERAKNVGSILKRLWNTDLFNKKVFHLKYYLYAPENIKRYNVIKCKELQIKETDKIPKVVYVDNIIRLETLFEFSFLLRSF